ncbi:MAG TPA: Lsr2 family protein [Streptosporangiaceae bacterium]|jgi:hypothetical protein|nr:Lsr2 family protein [Streptosporangiaceae bacterium]
MAQKTVVTVLCDLPHDSEVEGTESISFAVDGNAYLIDLCPPHSEEFGNKIGAFAAHARRALSGTRRRRGKPGQGRRRGADIREWARARGHAISDRGRIPDSVIAAYEAAH